jgi:hypothetical protein
MLRKTEETGGRMSREGRREVVANTGTKRK